MSPTESFRAAMREAGLDYDGEIKGDGSIHHFAAGHDKAKNSWYVLHLDDRPAGRFGCHKRGVESEGWSYKNGDLNLSASELAAARQRWRQQDEQRAAERIVQHEQAAAKAAVIIAGCRMATADHPYLAKKKVGVHGDLLLLPAVGLVLPLRDTDGESWSFQTIDNDGRKLFMEGGRVSGVFFSIGAGGAGDAASTPLAICEGYATGATIHAATGWTVVCAMNCNNLVVVAKDLRLKFPDRIIVVAADDDRFTENNPGLTKAALAVKAVGGRLIAPIFSDLSQGTDFNDLQQESGHEEVRRQLMSALVPEVVPQGTIELLDNAPLSGNGEYFGGEDGQRAVKPEAPPKRMSISELLAFESDKDAESVLGKRYLCRGGSCLIIGQTSAGKSSFGLQMAVHFALGGDFFGLTPGKPLKSVFVQAENDLGDMAEMLQGILLGTGQIHPSKPDRNKEIALLLDKNLIIIRDQTHTGKGFSQFASKIAEEHKPDLFWCDPVLSFYGDDINDQRAMSAFLRHELNPISEKTGLIWMLLHHTGKPSKDATKAQKSWSAIDFAYMGIGSSELSNWARATIAIAKIEEDEFRCVFGKRGFRAELKDSSGNPCTDLYLAHSTNHICWKAIPKPDNDGVSEHCLEFAKTLACPMRAAEIVEKAAAQMKRGSRTIWKFWGGGTGELGKLFIRNSVTNLYTLSSAFKTTTLPFRDD